MGLNICRLIQRVITVPALTWALWMAPASTAFSAGGGSSGFVLVGNDDVPPLEWWQEAVIYQIYPRSFQDSNGDGTGDLKGILSRLDYLQELGIGAVWLSPIYTSPMADFGYDISNFTDIDPIFGTLDDFRELITELQALGIRVIMDFIPNHSSDQHEWFLKSVAREEPYTDFYTWLDAKYDDDGNCLPPNNWVSVFGGSMWEWNEKRGQYYLHQFTKEQPDLRLENPLVTRALLDAMEFWMELGVDGFRMDACPHMFEDQRFLDEPPAKNVKPGTPDDEYDYWEHPYTFNLPEVLFSLREYRQLLDAKSATDGKTRIMLTEGYVPSLPELIKYYGTPSAPIAHFPFNFQLLGGSLPALRAAPLKKAIDGWMAAMPPGGWAWPNWLAGNHDNARVPDRFGPDLVDAVNAIVLLLPGTAVTYYGEELGMRGHRDISYEDTKDPAGRNAGSERYGLFSRDPERTPMQWDAGPNAGFSDGEETWLPIHPNYRTLNVEAQQVPEESHLKVYKALVALRQTPEWKYGSLETRVFGEVFGFTRSRRSTECRSDDAVRETETRSLVVLVNLGATKAKIDVTAFKGLGHAAQATATVYARSVGFAGVETVGSSVDLSTVSLEPGNMLVLKYTSTSTSEAGANGGDGGGAQWFLISVVGLGVLAAVAGSLWAHN